MKVVFPEPAMPMQRITGGCFLPVAGCSGVVGGGVLSAEDIVWKIYVECITKKKKKEYK